MAVNGGAHVLPGHNGPDFFLRWDILPGSSLPQRVKGEGSISIQLRAGEELSSPVERTIGIDQCRRFNQHKETNLISPKTIFIHL